MDSKERAVFIDRDGTLNHMVFNEQHGIIDSPFSLQNFHLKPGAGKFIAKINNGGFRAILVTNQPGIAKGALTEDRLHDMHQQLKKEIAVDGAHLDGIYYCPHHPDGSAIGNLDYIKECDCRKPLPGLLTKAAKDLDLDLSQSYMIGDGLIDVEAGNAAGCKTILITNLKLDILSIMVKRSGSFPDILVKSLDEALEDILRGKVLHPFPVN